jgi:IS30 family transposase
MAEVLSRSPSTISRELRRNRGLQGNASAHAREQRAERLKAGHPTIKLHADALLFDVVCHFLRLLWSPEQIALPLAHLFPPEPWTPRVTRDHLQLHLFPFR